MRSFLIATLLSVSCVAQAAKPTVRFSADRLVIQANGTSSVSACGPTTPQPDCFDPRKRGQIKVFQLLAPDTPEVHANDMTTEFLTDDVTYSESTGEITVVLKSGSERLLKPGTTYFVRVSPFPSGNAAGKGGELLVKTEISGTIGPGLDAARPQAGVGLTSPVVLTSDGAHPLRPPVQGNAGSAITVNQTVTTIKNDDLVEQRKPLPGSVTAVVNNTYFIALDKKLKQNSSNNLTAELKDEAGNPVSLKGTVEIQGAPVDDKNTRINLMLASTAAVHQAPVFTLAGTFAPLHNDLQPWALWNNQLIWDPSVKVDIGLRSTKSADSIVFGNVLLHKFPFRLPLCPCPTCGYCPPTGNKIGTYFRARHQPFTTLSDIAFNWAVPSIETDREFDKVNVVTQLRVEFGFYRLRQSTADQSHYLVADLDKKTLAGVSGLNIGYSFIPYLQLAGGGQLMDQVVTNSKVTGKPSVTVPAYGVLRGYAGALIEVDLYRFTLTLDHTLMRLAQSERAGYLTPTGVGQRTVQGVQYHGKSSLDYSLDRGKHYRFSIAYENGRTPPIWEYLNKVETGFKAVY